MERLSEYIWVYTKSNHFQGLPLYVVKDSRFQARFSVVVVQACIDQIGRLALKLPAAINGFSVPCKDLTRFKFLIFASCHINLRINYGQVQVYTQIFQVFSNKPEVFSGFQLYADHGCRRRVPWSKLVGSCNVKRNNFYWVIKLFIKTANGEHLGPITKYFKPEIKIVYIGRPKIKVSKK